MCKYFEMIKKFRAGNRITVECDCHRTVLLRRRESCEPIGKMEINHKDEVLLADVLAVLGAMWLLCRITRAIGCLFR